MYLDLTRMFWHTGFMSSVDLHTHSGFQRMLPESFAVVCAPHSTPKYVFLPGRQVILFTAIQLLIGHSNPIQLRNLPLDGPTGVTNDFGLSSEGGISPAFRAADLYSASLPDY
jgi:hypothetical protein